MKSDQISVEFVMSGEPACGLDVKKEDNPVGKNIGFLLLRIRQEYSKMVVPKGNQIKSTLSLIKCIVHKCLHVVRRDTQDM